MKFNLKASMKNAVYKVWKLEVSSKLANCFLSNKDRSPYFHSKYFWKTTIYISGTLDVNKDRKLNIS